MMLVLLKPCKQAKGGAGKGRKEVRRIEELGVRISERMEDIHFGQSHNLDNMNNTSDRRD